MDDEIHEGHFTESLDETEPRSADTLMDRIGGVCFPDSYECDGEGCDNSLRASAASFDGNGWRPGCDVTTGRH